MGQVVRVGRSPPSYVLVPAPFSARRFAVLFAASDPERPGASMVMPAAHGPGRHRSVTATFIVSPCHNHSADTAPEALRNTVSNLVLRVANSLRQFSRLRRSWSLRAPWHQRTRFGDWTKRVRTPCSLATLGHIAGTGAFEDFISSARVVRIAALRAAHRGPRPPSGRPRVSIRWPGQRMFRPWPYEVWQPSSFLTVAVTVCPCAVDDGQVSHAPTCGRLLPCRIVACSPPHDDRPLADAAGSAGVSALHVSSPGLCALGTGPPRGGGFPPRARGVALGHRGIWPRFTWARVGRGSHPICLCSRIAARPNIRTRSAVPEIVSLPA